MENLKLLEQFKDYSRYFYLLVFKSLVLFINSSLDFRPGQQGWPNLTKSYIFNIYV